MKTLTSFVLALLASASLFAGEVTSSVGLTWSPNTESDLAGYKVYQGTASGVYDKVTDVGLVTLTTVDGLAVGPRYFFVVTAYNTARLESDPSNEVEYEVPSGTPVTKVTTLQVNRTATKIALNWSANPASELVFLYEIEWKMEADPEWSLDSVSATAVPLGFIINSDRFTSYVVRIRAIGPDGPGPWFERLVPGLPPTPPTGLMVNRAGAISYTWKP